MNNEPILIAGIDAIARALGLSPATVEKEIIGRPGFPARQLTPRGQWLTTRKKLVEWAESMFPTPYYGEGKKRTAEVNRSESPPREVIR